MILSVDRHIQEHTHDLYAQLRTFLWTQWRHEKACCKCRLTFHVHGACNRRGGSADRWEWRCKSHYMYVWRVCAPGAVRAALRPGVSANVTRARPRSGR